MKLKDIKAPKGYQIKGFDYPSVGDYILLPSGEEFKIDTHHHAYHCAGIILEETWKPEIGKYYEFSDYVDFPTPILRKYVGSAYAQNTTLQYLDETGESWRYIRPVKEELLGK